MGSALLHKSVTDLTRRKARTAFAVLALAIAVASVGIFALPPLADRAMQKENASSRLADLTIDTAALRLTPAQEAALAGLPNVDAFSARSLHSTRARVGDRRAKAYPKTVADVRQEPEERIPAGRADQNPLAGPGSPPLVTSSRTSVRVIETSGLSSGPTVGSSSVRTPLIVSFCSE